MYSHNMNFSVLYQIFRMKEINLLKHLILHCEVVHKNHLAWRKGSNSKRAELHFIKRGRNRAGPHEARKGVLVRAPTIQEFLFVRYVHFVLFSFRPVFILYAVWLRYLHDLSTNYFISRKLAKYGVTSLTTGEKPVSDIDLHWFSFK